MWERDELDKLDDLAQEMGWDADSGVYKKRKKLILKIGLQKLAEEARGAGPRRSAVGKITFDETLIDSCAKGKTFGFVKDNILPGQVQAGKWKQDTACPSSRAKGGHPARRYLLRHSGETIRVRVVQNPDGSYDVQQGQAADDYDEDSDKEKSDEEEDPPAQDPPPEPMANAKKDNAKKDSKQKKKDKGKGKGSGKAGAPAAASAAPAAEPAAAPAAAPAEEEQVGSKRRRRPPSQR